MQKVTKDTWGCVGNSIRLRSGRYFDLADPRPDMFLFLDIAGALSKICRFGGQVSEFYSVAEHSVHCARIAAIDGHSLAAQAAVLMHDAAEAFCGDVVKPLKIMLPEYAEIERRVEAVIARSFGIDFEAHHDLIREIDRAALIAERHALFSADRETWTGEEECRTVNIDVCCWPPAEAERLFCAAAFRIGLVT